MIEPTITVHDGNGNRPTKLTKAQYDDLVKSGMMWEFHPDAPDRWPYPSMTPLPPCLGLGFTRAVGKDTLAALMAQLDPRVRRYAFADPLKQDFAPFLSRHFGIDIWRCTPEEKEIVRPILIAYGMSQRARDPDYWVKRTVEAIKADIAKCPPAADMIIPVVTDVRFSNEIDILRRELGALIVHVTRDGAPPPTDEEAKHYAGLIPLADKHLHWGNDTFEEQTNMARVVLGWLKR
jgi:hypothetical protein